MATTRTAVQVLRDYADELLELGAQGGDAQLARIGNGIANLATEIETHGLR